MFSNFKFRKVAAPVAVALVVMAGCAVGPDFKRPAAPSVKNYTAKPLANPIGTTNVAGGDAQRFVQGLKIPAQWWALFHSRPLNDLITRALTNNPDLAAARSAMVVAQENVKAQRGMFYPNVSGSFSGSINRLLLRRPPMKTFSSTIYSRRK